MTKKLFFNGIEVTFASVSFLLYLFFNTERNSLTNYRIAN